MQGLIRVLLVLLVVGCALAQTQQTDGAALCGFYNGLTANAGKSSLRNWCVGSGPYSPCGSPSWTGVTCGTVGRVRRVVKLDVSSKRLAGSLSTAIGNLGALTGLCLWRNSLSGSLPSLVAEWINCAI